MPHCPSHRPGVAKGLPIMSGRFLLPLALFVGAGATPAAVVDTTAMGFLVKNEVDIQAPAEKVYRALVHDVGHWWNPVHTYTHDAMNLYIESKAGGCFCERLPSGGSVQHMTIINVQPGKLLRMSGALGPLQSSGLAATLTWSLTEQGTNTKLEVAYSVGGYIQGGVERLAPPVDSVLSDQAQRLKAFVETGKAS
jgi:uncharacterized protein YndB with AHSA1/START domain